VALPGGQRDLFGGLPGEPPGRGGAKKEPKRREAADRRAEPASDRGDADRAKAPPPPADPFGDAITVSDLVSAMTRRLEGDFGRVAVAGEIASLTRSGPGHLYFTLKDARAQVNCVMFRTAALRLRYRPTAGLDVVALGGVSLYAERGSLQLYVDDLVPRGRGAAQLALEEVKARLAADGLTAREHKRRLPAWPRRVAVVTSPDGAAWRDIVKVARRRMPGLPLLLVPARVQGADAVGDLVRALKRLDRYIATPDGRDVSAIIIARGGGSAEDLAAFNDESVARAVATAGRPVVSGVGHEVDVSVVDLVADVRAATPSHAAELVVPDRREWRRRLRKIGSALGSAMSRRVRSTGELLARDARRLEASAPERLVRSARQTLDAAGDRLDASLGRLAATARQRLDAIATRLRAQEPGRRLADQRQRLSTAAARLADAAPNRRLVSAKREQCRQLADRLHAAAKDAAAVDPRRALAAAADRLEALSPLRVLTRGYAVATDAAGAIITDAGAVPPGSEIAIRPAKGRLTARVIDNRADDADAAEPETGNA
jgi:exodeoxyribonuclease VII large subunit